MSSMDIANSSGVELPRGAWRVDSTASQLEFSARGMFGLATVRGTFNEFEGELDVDDMGSRGELRIKATSLDTGNSRRDKHLRSADFFDVVQHPTVTFSLAGTEPQGPDGVTFTGSLQIRQNRLDISGPARVALNSDRLQLVTDLAVDRVAAGVGWSKLGMIRGDAQLHAALSLTRRS